MTRWRSGSQQNCYLRERKRRVFHEHGIGIARKPGQLNHGNIKGSEHFQVVVVLNTRSLNVDGNPVDVGQLAIEQFLAGRTGEGDQHATTLVAHSKTRPGRALPVPSRTMSDSNRWAADDVIDADKQAAIAPDIEVPLGIVLTHRSTKITGRVIAFTEGQRIVLKDAAGQQHEFAPIDGFFEHDGLRVALRAPRTTGKTAPRFTPSGSVEVGASRAKVARASRIWVEGIHDAELIEKIWGDDLREEGVVVEPLHGADDLAAAVRDFEPGPARRLGVLLDHLVEGSKESRLAAEVTSPHVLITGHPYVDIWQAIKPAAFGIDAWPLVPRSEPWKEGVVAALGFREETGQFWRGVLASVATYADVETPLVNAVEQLLDFVAGQDD